MDRRLQIGIALLLWLATACLYCRMLSHAFVYDDEAYVACNRHLSGGLTMQNIKWAFTSTYAANWHPLTWISHLVDISLFGKAPGWHHAANIVLHATNAVLLFLVFLKLTGYVWESWFVAALFALHPLRIESVAWVAERKDVLSGFFWLLTMLIYTGYARSWDKDFGKRTTKYLLCVFLYALGLMAKPMLVTLPFVLILLDFWPLRRLEAVRPGGELRLGTKTDKRLIPLIVEKIPFFVLAAASCVVTYIAQEKGGAMRATQQLPLGVRLANVPVAYVSYLLKTIWPRDLAVFYPHPVRSLPAWWVICSSCILVLVTLYAVNSRRQRPYTAFGWLWFLGTLVPVIGFVQVGSQAMADRYTYMPQVGILVLATWSFSEAVVLTGMKSKTVCRRMRLRGFAGVVVLLAFATCTAIQLGYWKNPMTLFSRALAVTRDNFIAHVNLGIAFADSGDNARAIPHFYAALRLKPFDADTHRALADALAKEGRLEESIEHYRWYLEAKPSDARVRCVVADILAQLKRYDEAISEYQKVIKTDPSFAEAHTNYGVALVAKGRIREGIAQYYEALRLNPSLPDVHYNLGIAYAKLRRFEDSARELKLAVEEKPEDCTARQRLAVILFEIGDYRGVWEQVAELRKRGFGVPDYFIASLMKKMRPPPEYQP